MYHPHRHTYNNSGICYSLQKSSERLHESVRTKPTNIELVDWQAIKNWMAEKPGNKANMASYISYNQGGGGGWNITLIGIQIAWTPPPRMLQGSFLHKKQRGYKASIRSLIARPHQAQLLLQY